MKLSINAIYQLICNASILQVKTDDEDRLIREITKLCAKDILKTVYFWTSYLGLHEINRYKTKMDTFSISKFSRTKSVPDCLDPDRVLDFIVEDTKSKKKEFSTTFGNSSVFFLLDFLDHETPTLTRKLKDVAREAQLADTSVVLVTGGYIRIPAIYTVASLVELGPPNDEEISALLKDLVEKHVDEWNKNVQEKDKINPNFEWAEVKQSLKGLSEVKMIELLQLCMVETNSISAEKIYQYRKNLDLTL